MSAETNPVAPPTRLQSSIDHSLVESLEKQIAARPDKESLVEKNILKDDKVAPSLQAARSKLERSQLEDKLDHAIQNRPKADDLVKAHILHADEAPPSTA